MEAADKVEDAKRRKSTNAGHDTKKPWIPESGRRIATCNCRRHDQVCSEKKASGRSLRAFVAAWYEKHFEEYQALWDGMKAGASFKADGPNWKGQAVRHLGLLPGADRCPLARDFSSSATRARSSCILTVALRGPFAYTSI
ncbi:unnamed protein product [Effrenium voratum]|uniref:Uncharacterized protein n=1 Tax=Effrenium voratum TaxID=2562239 RepID=A0AA36MNH5_9DINO|nr:unnamed protein product [Effrenium voratum]CAJ1378391.1 unnamed protein product [Effrenium voratum]CAJ1421898.1 unnamed protein product [Effrenium voratum]